MNSTWEWRKKQPHAYLRSEDLSNFIFVCDIRHAIVSPPISQGKAPKWHDGIHLRSEHKKHFDHFTTKGGEHTYKGDRQTGRETGNGALMKHYESPQWL